MTKTCRNIDKLPAPEAALEYLLGGQHGGVTNTLNIFMGVSKIPESEVWRGVRTNGGINLTAEVLERVFGERRAGVRAETWGCHKDLSKNQDLGRPRGGVTKTCPIFRESRVLVKSLTVIMMVNSSNL